jgi:tRNA nucleotidyltransferase (CCA-adding enzyme)
MARGAANTPKIQIDDDDMRVGAQIEELFTQPFAGAARSVRQRLEIEYPEAELLVVGGAVRDVVAGRKPKDLDLMVRHVPEDELVLLLERLAGDERLAMYQSLSDAKRQRVLDTLCTEVRAEQAPEQEAAIGMTLPEFDAHVAHVAAEHRFAWLPRMRGRLGREGDHFTVTRYHAPDRSEVEVVLPRVDISTGPEHRDATAIPDHNMSVEDDMARRDFTVNAMAFSLRSGRLVDPFDGAGDLRDGRLRTVSDQSFHDDHLRMLRGLVLAGRYRLSPDDVCDEQYREQAHNLDHVAQQRIVEELLDNNKIIHSEHASFAVRVGERYGLISRALGNLDIDQDAFERAAEATDSRRVRLAALLHTNDGTVARDRLHELEHESEVFEHIGLLLDAPRAPSADDTSALAAWAGELRSREVAMDALRMQAAVDARPQNVAAWTAALDRPIYRSEISLTGRDLIAAGVEPGKQMGELLAKAQRLVWQDPARNDTAGLLASLDLPAA